MKLTGGDPDAIATGVQPLYRVAESLEGVSRQIGSGADRAAGAAGEADLESALGQFGAAWETLGQVTSQQVTLAASLASTTAADLSDAG